MNTKIEWLLGLVLLQLLLVVLVLFSDSFQEEENPRFSTLDESLVAFFEIADQDSSVKIERGDTQWQVDGYPADADKINSTLKKISELNAQWPIADTVTSAGRFEVGEDSFQRKLSFYDQEKSLLEEFYLGTSPSYQRVHARQAGSSSIYSVKLSNYEFGLKRDDWLDKTLASVSGDISRIHITSSRDGFAIDKTITQDDGVWKIQGELADQAAAKIYVERFNNLRVLGIADESGEKVADLELTVDGKKELISLFGIEDEEGAIEDYFVEPNDVPGIFRLATYVAEQILLTDTDLLPSDPEGEPTE